MVLGLAALAAARIIAVSRRSGLAAAISTIFDYLRLSRRRLEIAPDALAIEVVDDGGRGRRAAGPGLDHVTDPGRGLIGMVERAALFGGALEAGRHGTGFRIAATLPFTAPSDPAALATAPSAGAAQ